MLTGRGLSKLARQRIRLCPRSARAASTVAPTRPPSRDDEGLVDFFDRPRASASTWFRSSTTSTGLFLQPALTQPSGFTQVAEDAVQKARRLVDRILRAPADATELRKVVKNLDRLSNVLCCVVDLAELVRHSHPDSRWVDAANDAYGMLYEYMNVLNTDVGLYDVLKKVLHNPDLASNLSPEERETALIFWRDFEKSGIDLPPQLRTRFVQLSSEIITLGRDFVNNSNAARPPVYLPASQISGLLRQSRMRLPIGTRNTIAVYPGTSEARMLMASVPDDATRRALYLASNSSSPEEIEVLQALLKTRAQLASLLGKESYAHVALDDKMTKSPDNVMTFLQAQLHQSRPRALVDVRGIAEQKRISRGDNQLPPVEAWDREYYMPRIPSAAATAMPDLTPGTVFYGLSRLFTHLFGVSLRPAALESGEVWHQDVRKLEVIDEDEGLVGWIYADLFGRPGKASGAAHYTVRCSRRVDDDDVEGDFPDRIPIAEEDRGLRIPGYTVRGRPGKYQLPVVVLLCDFPSPTLSGAAHLDWNDVMTTVHEMGHAVHSMIGRTDYQNVAGTRCATDFVELPSLLMEHFFLSSPDVLSLFRQPGEPQLADLDTITATQASPGAALDAHTQLIFATLDQLYHSPLASADTFDSTAVFAKLQDEWGVLPHVPGTSWQTRFSHLYGYAATYYSYIFDKALARAVWERVFARAPLEREAGERFRQGVLRYGGGKDPWAMLASVLDMPELERGDVAAMKQVGQWRAEGDGLRHGTHSH
ncbi:mitochondrial intermediate peptidase [Exidia glandulosa HHB12029]|uniref:Mitochondrial intermediate peptidase n=1 Tax=Exidia glandulosa HHB12029 TaxID=1314781 RepID=A0A165MBW0_EXIGL|nr:mitochondrial intermediate peptidase [Exidia glandulosa HHB12029]